MANLRTNNLSGEQGQNAYRGSVFFDGVDNSNLAITSNSDFTFGTGVFTAECWIRVGAYPASNVYGIFDTGTSVNANRFSMVMYPTGKIYIDNNSNLIISDTILSTDSWHHLAFVREGTGSNESKLYINGVLDKSATISSDFTNDDILIGKTIDNYEFKGYISNARITKGEAVYTANFTPSTSELTADANTVLLCCQDSNDPTQEETGKTITASGSLATAGYLETQPKVIPPVGRDAGNAFGGPIQQSTQGYMYFPTGRTEERVIVNNNFGTRGLVFQGLTYPSAPSSTYLNTIEFITVASLGNATDFGDLISKNNAGAGAGNLTRGIQVSGNDPSGATNVIQFVTIASTGNAQDFGDVGYERCNAGAVSNQTRLVYSGGEGMSSPYPQLNNIEFITFASTGNGTDFGDQVDTVNSPYGVSSPTRGVFMGGSGATPTIQSIEIATTGNSILFGDLTSALYNVRGTITNGHRGVIAGGVISPTGRVNNIDYITIQSGGKSITFGDLTDARDPSNLSSMTRGVMLSGDYPANVNIMDFIEIMTTGNAVDFGDCNKSSSSSTASNGHGGLADAM